VLQGNQSRLVIMLLTDCDRAITSGVNLIFARYLFLLFLYYISDVVADLLWCVVCPGLSDEADEEV
jgi:hypothetical protein